MSVKHYESSHQNKRQQQQQQLPAESTDNKHFTFFSYYTDLLIHWFNVVVRSGSVGPQDPDHVKKLAQQSPATPVTDASKHT